VWRCDERAPARLLLRSRIAAPAGQAKVGAKNQTVVSRGFVSFQLSLPPGSIHVLTMLKGWVMVVGEHPEQ